MICSICGLQVDSIEEAIEQGWTPYFYEGTDLHDVACPSCTEMLLRHGERGEMEVKKKFRGKLRFLDDRHDEEWQEHSQGVMVVLENEPGKLN
jgi:hypothetical protein